LWELAEPLIPAQRRRPQGGGTEMLAGGAGGDRVHAANPVRVAASARPVRVSKATAHRRFIAWTRAGLWRRLHTAALERLGAGLVDWSRAAADAAHVR